MKRIIYKLLNKKVINKKEKTIGVVGVTKGIGTTFLSLAIGNFISSCMRERVIYIELAEKSSLLSMVGKTSISVGDSIGYKYKGVEYVLTSDIEEVIRILASEMAWIVVDIKELNSESSTILNLCKKKIVTGSFLPWNQRDYQEFIRKNIYKKYDMNTIDFYQRNKDKAGEKAFKELYGQRLNVVPILNNPFSLQEENFEEIKIMIM